MAKTSPPSSQVRSFPAGTFVSRLAHAEALAERTIQTLSDPIPLEEFQRLVTGTKSGKPKVVIGLYGRFRRSLGEGEQHRLDVARIIATGDANRQIWDKPIPRVEEYYLGRAQKLASQLLQAGEVLAPSEYVRRVIGREIDAEHLSEYIERIRSSMSPEGQKTWDRLFRDVTGRESGQPGLPVLPYDQLVRAAQALASSAQRSGRAQSIPEFQRGVLSITDRSVDDRTVASRFSYARLKMSDVQRESVDRCMQIATGVYGGSRGVVESPDRRLKIAKQLAAEVARTGQVMSPNDFGRAVMESNAIAIAPMVSRWRARLSEKDQKAFDQAKATATGKSGTTAGGGQVFAPDADQMNAAAALARKMGATIFVPSERLPDTQSTPLHPIDPKLLQLPGLIAVVLDLTKPLVFPAGAIDWRRFTVPPSECRPHITGAGAPSGDEGNVPEELPSPVDLPGDLPPPASLVSTPIPRMTLTPATVGILVAAGLLVLCDGPLPLGDAAAASLVGGRLLTN